MDRVNHGYRATTDDFKTMFRVDKNRGIFVYSNPQPELSILAGQRKKPLNAISNKVATHRN